MGAPNRKTIRLNYLTRVEGEASLLVKVKGDFVQDVELKIFEPPRFFEALLRGRKFAEAPDITSRICGICPAAYQIAAVQAIEDALGITVEPITAHLRSLLTCGEWIQSHALHIYMLHAPDFLNCSDVLDIARQDRAFVERGLKLKSTGNRILQVLGGRDIHPVNVRVGGFYRMPSQSEIRDLVPALNEAMEIAIQTAEWCGKLQYPSFERNYRYLSIQHPTDYPMNEGKIALSGYGTFSAEEFETYVHEEQVPYSNALQANALDAPYLVGPLARYNLNFQNLSSFVQALAGSARVGEVCRNPYRSILIRSLELVHACEVATKIAESYEVPSKPFVDCNGPKAGKGYACIEAPRGTLYHAYEIDKDGFITNAKIIPPTSQNQKMIENDVRDVVAANLREPDEKLRIACEHAIRNYDPCISCATHFLKVNLEQV